MGSFHTVAAGALLASALLSPGQAQTIPADLRLAGSNTVGEELAPAFVRAYAAARLNLRTEKVEIGAGEQQRRFIFSSPDKAKPLVADIEARGTATGFVALRDHAADIAMASRAVNDKEVNELVREPLRTPAAERIAGLDGVLVLVHTSNSVRSLTRAQIEGIFCGRVTDWSEVGRDAGPINVYRRDDNSGTTDTFKSLAMPGCPGAKPFVETAKLFTSSEDLSDAVAADPNGIGYAGFAYRRAAKAVDIAGACGQSTPATEFTVKTEEYPLARRLFLYAPEARQSPAIKAFLDFAANAPEARKVVTEAGFINLDVIPAPGDYNAARAKPMAQAGDAKTDRLVEDYGQQVRGAGRLSVALHFRTGSAQLDPLAEQQVRAIAAAQAAGQYGKRKLRVLGFTDNVGDQDRNISLSRARARMVAARLRAEGATVAAIDGFADLSPVACNDTPWGLDRNRRVEVWLASE